jgi:cytochrome c553
MRYGELVVNASSGLRVVAGLLALSGSLAAAAQDMKAGTEDMLKALSKDPQSLAAAVKAGAAVAEFCDNCHGPGGNSSQADVPNLAGQNVAYLLDQVQKYADGRRRDDFMQGLTKVLDREQRVSLVLYYATQTPVRQPPPAQPLARQGKRLYADLCESCHGAQGLGEEKLARIAGQQQQYLGVALKRYRGRAAQPVDAKMARIVRTLSEGELQALIAYVSVMR